MKEKTSPSDLGDIYIKSTWTDSTHSQIRPIPISSNYQCQLSWRLHSLSLVGGPFLLEISNISRKRENTARNERYPGVCILYHSRRFWTREKKNKTRRRWRVIWNISWIYAASYIRVYYLVRCSKRIRWGLVMIFLHLLKNKNKKNKKRGGDEEWYERYHEYTQHHILWTYRVYYLVRCSKRIRWGLVMIFLHLLKNKNKKNKKRGGDEEQYERYPEVCILYLLSVYPSLLVSNIRREGGKIIKEMKSDEDTE